MLARDELPPMPAPAILTGYFKMTLAGPEYTALCGPVTPWAGRLVEAGLFADALTCAGMAEAEGVITVIQIPALTRIQPPIANDDNVTVRVGDAIDIPVLSNDEHPDGLTLTLQPVLDQALPENSGLLFASGRVLRYLAPDKTGNFTAAYRVTGPDGQAGTGHVDYQHTSSHLGRMWRRWVWYRRVDRSCGRWSCGNSHCGRRASAQYATSHFGWLEDATIGHYGCGDGHGCSIGSSGQGGRGPW